MQYFVVLHHVDVPFARFCYRASAMPSASPPVDSSSTDDAPQSEGVRLRRTKSSTRADDILREEKMLRENQPDHPCHRARDSYFSWTSGFADFSGFVNWAFLLLSIGGFRLMLENYNKYGLRVHPSEWVHAVLDSSGSIYYPSIILILALNIPAMFTLFVENLLAYSWVSESVGVGIQTGSLLFLFLTPILCIDVLATDAFSLLGASSVAFMYCVALLKLISYVQVNYWCRHSRRKNTRVRMIHRTASICEDRPSNNTAKENHTTLQKYPDNLTIGDLYYFLAAPTLCYELNFPRTTRVRKQFVVKRLLEVIIGTNLVLALNQQWLLPSIKNSLTPFSHMDLSSTVERLLKLSIPNHLLWLLCFYLLFHSWLNLLGELLKFADRAFYGAWWNADNINHFWRTWNLPVHRWAIRHLYRPLLKRGFDKFSSSSVVFFVSGVLHEYLVSVPLRLFKVWAVLGMMYQIPLAIVTDLVQRKYGERWANVMVWQCLILGQPLAILMYFHDYVIEHFGSESIPQFSEIS